MTREAWLCRFHKLHRSEASARSCTVDHDDWEGEVQA